MLVVPLFGLTVAVLHLGTTILLTVTTVLTWWRIDGFIGPGY